jgi:hypothetical protein
MNYLAVKDLKAPRFVRETLAKYGEAMVMNNGRPMALMLDIGPDEDPSALLAAVHEARGRLALSRLREAARRKGRARMTLAEINAEIGAARGERATRVRRQPAGSGSL